MQPAGMIDNSSTAGPARIYLPEALTAVVIKGQKAQEPRSRVVKKMMRIQRSLVISCRGCRARFHKLVFSKAQAAELCKLAQRSFPPSLLREVEQWFQRAVAVCPGCGVESHPPLWGRARESSNRTGDQPVRAGIEAR